MKVIYKYLKSDVFDVYYAEIDKVYVTLVAFAHDKLTNRVITTTTLCDSKYTTKFYNKLFINPDKFGPVKLTKFAQKLRRKCK